ncbi:hypothetical protein [Sutcliffiella halmapala]|uniref:hypothetical protein n=1 Tax=Sutcliffiella halmapala TaxID=79882 RepID=UPI000994F46B|nr:hypothetical protein [Sutcliffiella halmapala]
MILRGTLSGLASGFIMGFFIRGLEAVSSKKIYILLLNIDFIPYLGKQHFSEAVEFTFHLFISLIIGIVFAWMINKYSIHSKAKQFVLALCLTLPTVFLYFPLTELAIKETPAVTDIYSFSLWTIGHLIFACLLPVFYWLPKIKQRG